MRSSLVCLFCIVSFSISAQDTLQISNGVSIPARDTIRGLIVFAEVDFSTGHCPCGDSLPDNLGASSSWPVLDGKTQIPNDASTYLNPTIDDYYINPAFITDIYYQASYGEYVLLGDYFPEVITLGCNEIKRGNDGVDLILDRLDAMPDSNGTLYTEHGFSLKDFDHWTPTSSGVKKIKEPDGRIDMLYIIWKNNRFVHTCHTRGNAGYGISSKKGKPFKDMEGINTRASYNAVNSAPRGYTIMLMEHMHGIFGGNHWHAGGGAGMHSVIAIPGNYGLTAQFNAAMKSFCAWDRWMMDWKGNRNYLISALDEKGVHEIDTETISIDTHKNGITFILRDFTATGDAARIKLPHLDYERDSIKNQYIWLENRQMKTRFDEYLSVDCANKLSGYEKGTPGIYAYYQIGKDVKKGGREIYSTYPYSHPNALGSYLLPITAEGDFDYHLRRDLEVPAKPNLGCGHWGNANIPIHRRKNKPNPLTGFNDLYLVIDSNEDGVLYKKDRVQSGLSEVVYGDSVVHNYHMKGDWKDAFTSLTGQTKMNIGTNPSPTPVYTYRSGNGYTSPARQQPEDFENRKIDLSGLSIEILDEDALNDGSGAIKVLVTWNEYEISNHVRWCGEILLHPNDFDKTAPSLILKKRKRISLERGKSPMYYEAVEFDSTSGEHLFTDPTRLNITPNAHLALERRAKIDIEEGSTLNIFQDATLRMERRSRIRLSGKNDTLRIHPEAHLKLHRRAFVFVGKKRYRIQNVVKKHRNNEVPLVITGEGMDVLRK